MRIEDLKGFIDFPGGFQLLKGQPIDSRYFGEDLEFLQSVIDIGAAYPGLRIFIVSENKTYVYKKGRTGEYSFQLETVSFTQSEEEALSSGITKEKVKEFESKYKVPSEGIPENDLSKEIRNKLNRAGMAITEESDPTVPSWAKQANKPTYSVEEIEGLDKELGGKVSSEEGKGLSEENFSSGEKAKLGGIEEKAQVNIIEGVTVNNQPQPIVDKKVQVKLKTLNGETLAGDGDVKVVSTDSDQNIEGHKTFSKEVSVPPKAEIDLENPRSRAVATEAQIAAAIGKLGGPLTSASPLNAGKLYGNLPDNLVFPRLNQDTTGNSGSADRLKTARQVYLSGKLSSKRISFDGSKDVNIEVESLSQNPQDYPVFNQDTTGNSGSADKLATPRKLKVDLGRNSGTANFDGAYDQEDIPVKGRLNVENLLQGQGTGVKRKVLSTNTSVEVENLGLYELTPADVGLDKVLNEEQATKAQLDALKSKIDRLESLGSFVGSYETYEDLPKTIGGILGKYGVEATVNDFVTVRGGKYPDKSAIEEGSATCWSITSIDPNGEITWAYEYTYNFDLSGKIDRVTGDIEGRLPVLTLEGNLESSGKKIADLILANEEVSPGLTYKQKIINSLLSSDTIYGAYKLIHPGTSDPCNHGSTSQPVYFKDGTPVLCEKVAAIDSKGVVKGIDGDGNPTVNLEIDLAKNSELAKKAKAFVDKDGNPARVGGSLTPIFLDEQGVPRAMEKGLGDLAFEDVIVTSMGDILFPGDENPDDWEGGTLRVYRNTKAKSEGEDDYTPGDRFRVEFIGDSQSVTNWYGLIYPREDQADRAPFDQRHKLRDLIKESFGVSSDIYSISGNEEGNYHISSEAHGIHSFVKVRVFEVKGDMGSSNLDPVPDNIYFSEKFGMAEISLSGNVTIKVN
jgi:hypothetical protein